ncbi:restriction endonuclease subunit S [Rufibacter quisquiliarum]|uniref:Type I restriction enzyme S subunit n=1 Tax=Rufibacter quisquiliarum TaxID=1549639 RepID=A0A839GX04_9BACT|nr:restriction endonuclease subunit S [Rufibacter quisquiliarum]MBA9078261.1 type I restriction enzyme S subunit [Rufibacter quisquiliarum]
MILNDVCELIIDTEHKTAPNVEVGIPSIRTPNVGKGRLILDKDIKYVDEPTFVQWTKRAIPRKDDLIIAREAPVGNVALVPDIQLCLGQRTVLARPDKRKVSPSFLCYYLLSPKMQHKMLSGSGGSTVAHLNMKDIRNLELEQLPALPTQIKIASILSAYDDLIENNLKRIKLLEEKAALMYNSILVNLKETRKVSLYEIADIQMGYAFKAEEFNESGEGNPIIRIRDIPNQSTKSFTTQEVESKYIIEKGDLLIGMDGEFHINEWLGQKGYLVQRVCRLRSKDPFYQSFLWQALIKPIKFYESTISGATVAHLGKKHLEQIYLHIPDYSTSDMLVELNQMRHLKINLSHQNFKLQEARDILLPQLMNGEIEV